MTKRAAASADLAAVAAAPRMSCGRMQDPVTTKRESDGRHAVGGDKLWHAQDPLKPAACVPVPKGACLWRRVSLEEKLCIEGGYQTDTFRVATMKVGVMTAGIEGAQTFVKVAKDAPWLYKLVGGVRAQRGSLKRRKIIATLISKIVAVEGSDSAVAGDSAVAEAVDPMKGE